MASAIVNRIEELRNLYEELSMKPTPYYKSYIRVRYPKKDFHDHMIVHLHKDHEELKVSNYRDAIGIDRTHTFVEINVGTLYTCPTSTADREMNMEWSLIFKIDCDLAKKKTGSIDSALAHYVSDSLIKTSPAYSTNKLLESRAKLEKNLVGPYAETEEGVKKNPGGRPRKFSNSEDLLFKYGTKIDGQWDTEDLVTAWIIENKETLDASTEFFYDDYRSPVEARRSKLNFDENLASFNKEVPTHRVNKDERDDW